MEKSEHLGHYSGVFHGQPAYDYGAGNTCPWRTPECVATCIAYTGRNPMELQQVGSVKKTAKYRRTELLYKDYVKFFEQFVKEIKLGLKRSIKKVLIPTMRPNGTTDLTWESMIVPGTSGTIFDLFPELQFIDYTKGFHRLFNEKLPANYHLTYSLNKNSPADAVEQILTKTRHNVTQVYTKEKYEEVLARGYDVWNGFIAPVCSGDESDLRHLDPRGHVVALKYKVARNSRMEAIEPIIDGKFIRG
jgi:hypothetical protein